MKNKNKFDIYKLDVNSIKSLKGGVTGKRTETHSNWSKETARDRDNDVETKSDVVSISITPYLEV